MPKKTLGDWRNTWNDFSGTNAIKAQFLLQQYVEDSQTSVAGVLHPMTWFAASKGEHTQYLSADPVRQALTLVMRDKDVEFLLRHVKQRVMNFYSTEFLDINDMCEGDELFHVLQVIKEKTGVDCFAIDIMQDAEECDHSAHV
jgi:hypothetical protein